MRRSLEIDAKAIALYEAGLGLAKVGAIVGLSASTVYAILQEHGISRRARGRRWRPRTEEERAIQLAKTLPMIQSADVSGPLTLEDDEKCSQNIFRQSSI